MASDTVPAAVPGPNDPPHSTAPTTPAGGTQQQPGGLAGLLAPVAPARSAAFTLNPDQAATGPHDEAVAGASSSAFSNTETPENAAKTTKNGASSKQEKSVVRAWLLAGAERWRKGGDARLKSLDIRKAKAQARQVKENVTVNRAEKIVGGSTNSSTGNNSNSGKSLNNKASKKDSGGGQKNSSGSGPSGGAHKGGTGRGPGGSSGAKNNSGGSSGGGRGNGRGNGSGAGGSGGGAGRDRSPGGKGSTDRGGKDHTSAGKQQPSTSDKRGGGEKPSLKKTDGAGKPNSGGGTTGTGKAGPQGPSGKPGKDGTGQHAPKPSKADTGHGKTLTGASGPDRAGKDRLKPTDGTDRPWNKPNTGKGQEKANGGTQPTGQPAATKPSADKPQTGKNQAGEGENPNTTKTPGKDGNTAARPKPAPGTAPTPRINTQPSREAGYRDGTRAAKAVAHAQAWRDGARDGYRDTTEAADREKQRLDKAHADRKTDRTRAEDQPVTEPASSADYQQAQPPKPTQPPGPQPVQVTSTDASHIHLGQNADRSSISRGEVRTLRRFQQRLDDKTTRMTLVAEATRTLEQHAREQIKKVTELLEQARAVEGGEKLVAALTKLQEQAQVQVDKAADVHKRAIRGQEACKTLKSNTDTRYGAIYQAVVDSPETRSAKGSYYREMADA